jgi:hypothetical protein
MIPGVSDLVYLGWKPRICMFKKHPEMLFLLIWRQLEKFVLSVSLVLDSNDVLSPMITSYLP